MEFCMHFMGFLGLIYDQFLEFSFRSSQFCSLLVYVTLPLRDTPNQTISDLYILFFTISLNTNIILLEDSFSLLSLFIYFKSMTQSLEWKSLPGFTDSSNCVIHASASSSSKFTFSSLSPPPQCWPLQRGVDDVSVKISRVPQKKKLEIRRLECAEACLTLNDAVV